MTKEIRGIVDAVTDGDLNAANAAFDAALQQKREDAWVNSKHEFARTAFEYFIASIATNPNPSHFDGTMTTSEL